MDDPKWEDPLTWGELPPVQLKDPSRVELARAICKDLREKAGRVSFFRTLDLERGNCLLEGRAFPKEETWAFCLERLRLSASLRTIPSFIPGDQRREDEWVAAVTAQANELEAAAAAWESADQRLNKALEGSDSF